MDVGGRAGEVVFDFDVRVCGEVFEGIAAHTRCVIVMIKRSQASLSFIPMLTVYYSRG